MQADVCSPTGSLEQSGQQMQEMSVHVTGAGGDAKGALEGGCPDPAPLPGSSGGQTGAHFHWAPHQDGDL